VDKEELWYRLLLPIYREEGGHLKKGGRNSSAWWRVMVDICDGLEMIVGSWFDDNIRRVVEDGGSTYFWTNNWVVSR